MIYRLKQFYWGLTSSFKKDDIVLLNKYLSYDEKNLFMKMKKSDRFHSFRVCKESIISIKRYNISNIEEVKMAKCALLHDVGKIKASLNIIEKGIVVIMNKVTQGRFLKYNKYSRINNYYNHPIIGIEILRDIGTCDNEILYCIENHHNTIKNINNNLYLSILMISDNHN